MKAVSCGIGKNIQITLSKYNFVLSVLMNIRWM